MNFLELRDGTWFCLRRGATDRIFTTLTSPDGGQTWNRERRTGVRGKMPDLLQDSDGAIVLAVGIEGLRKGREMLSDPRSSFVRLFVSHDQGLSWEPDVTIPQYEGAEGIVPADSPVMVKLDTKRVLLVCQAMDRHRSDVSSRWGYDVGMSLMGAILERT